MKVRIYGGRSGYGTEWDWTYTFDCDTTPADVELFAQGLSDDFADEVEADYPYAGAWDYWYEWEILEGGNF